MASKPRSTAWEPHTLVCLHPDASHSLYLSTSLHITGIQLAGFRPHSVTTLATGKCTGALGIITAVTFAPPSGRLATSSVMLGACMNNMGGCI